MPGSAQTVHLSARQGTSDLWWMSGPFYCLDVETYMDADGDGVGDFAGLTRRLDHIASLGMSAIWMLPFHPCADRDDGYAVEDYYGIDHRFGTFGDFVTFRRAASERGLRILLDLVINHTSSRHPWFQASRASRTGPYADWYLWADEPIREAEGVVFPGEQHGNWTYAAERDQWYFHRFYDFQPDLNISNPAVREELYKVMGFWLELGVSGFRLDAAPFIIESVGIDGPVGAHDHALLRSVRSFVSRRSGDAILVGEANVAMDDMVEYFGHGDGDEVHLLFNFDQSSSALLALATEDPAPLRAHLDRLPPAPETTGWLNYARLHDELSVERLEERERQRVFEAFAPDEDERIYGRGLRRRLGPMLGDRRRYELLFSLTYSMPGVPLLLYGDELAIADRLDLPGRLSVRTPMPWSPADSAGFSTAPEEALVRPLADDDEYGYRRANVQDAEDDPDSLLHWFRRIFQLRRQCVEVAMGPGETLDVGDPCVFAHCCSWEGDSLVAMHNLTDQRHTVRIPQLDGLDCLTRVFGGWRGCKEQPAELELPASVELEPYGYCWLRGTEQRRPST